MRLDGEPTEIEGNDLEERLKTLGNRVEIALLLIKNDREDLIYTIIEDTYHGAQILLDKYCVKSTLP